jgi:hypothetical protein
MEAIAVETEVTAGFDLGDADLIVSSLDEITSLLSAV